MERETPIFQVDAFTEKPFTGNPAAVCLLEAPREEEWMQQVAAEMNLSETAFLHPEGEGFRLRWFTPAVEVPLCGHATLASAHILWETGKVPKESAIAFHTKSGVLIARREDDFVVLDFPAFGNEPTELPRGLIEALGVAPLQARRALKNTPGKETFLLVLESARDVREARPDFGLLRMLGPIGVIITAPGSGEVDFVSRFFVPWAGIDEDPVTGAAHCCLAPYWCERLGRNELLGYQASARGGFVGVRLSGARVFLRGKAVTVLRGALLG